MFRLEYPDTMLTLHLVIKCLQMRVMLFFTKLKQLNPAE